MTMYREHELGFLNFVDKSQYRRLLSLVELGPKRRKKFRSTLDHALRLDPSRSERLTGSNAGPSAILQRLRKEGAPSSAHIMSADARLDQREAELEEAIRLVKDSGSGGVISCLPGRLAYYQPEDVGAAYLLKS